MKILFALRLYSGLENSIINKKLQPSGIPTLYTLLESVDKKHNIKVLFFHKIPSNMQFSKYKEIKNRTVSFKEFTTSFEIISSFYNKNNFLKFHRIIAEVSHFITLVKYIKKEKPDLIYIDNANIWSAGIIARIIKIPVVFRLLGIYPYIANLSLIKIN